MITTLERLPDEVLLIIFSNVSWSELLTSLWSLNTRFDILICSTLSKSNSGLIIEPGLSFTRCHSILFPLISRSSSLLTCIERIDIDGTNSNACNLIYEWLFDDDKHIFRFPNLKSLILTQCLLIKPLLKVLPPLIKHQLDELTLTFDREIIELLTESKSNELLSNSFQKSNVF